MNPKIVVRAAALAFVVSALAVAAIEFGGRSDRVVGEGRGSPAARLSSDRFEAELARCRDLGEAGARDAACLDVWGESRRHFLGSK
ncbi:putative entry exclusion protein TrbK-alt [Pinisolibacter aquiterrae]|uniref:putative entry exclusion protein TrbK-alt n=1 Tax=Pinisolibacter aquiterrae TaxID=2815579 RepID=UPI001C3E416B|nr:putative entry exclusion protein TrbK-alt [Pinisolibacter aquiterrae]MBV5265085.1 putative entry exclusion protein TrbK-alt [Pinisolibacter aquiterrae]MCC8237095.1 putative entry exclusion protein TrbK-alt [Pinisolibacter aquiterrae]